MWLNESFSVTKRVLIGLLWLVGISVAHYQLNVGHEERPIVRVGYMPVITNMAAPLLDKVTEEQGEVRYQALKFASFAEMAEALRNDQIQVAFMIAPLSIVMRQQGADVRVVMIGNRHESTLVARKELKARSLKDLAGKTVAVPMRFSGHNISIRDLLREQGLSNSISVVEMNPPDMASALTTGSLDAYYVGEPFAAQTVKSGDADVVFRVSEVWPNFMCNLVVVKQDLIDRKPAVVQSMVNTAVRSGLWASRNPEKAATIVSRYWNQSKELVQYALTTPPDRIRYDRFLPEKHEFQDMADRMVKLNLLKRSDIDGLIEDRFARSVDLSGVTDLQSIIKK